MHRHLAVALVILVAVPAIDAQNDRGWTPDVLLKVKRVGAVVPSPDGTRAAFVVGVPVTDGEKSEYVSQIHVANADGTGGFQLTYGEKSSTSPKWAPDGQTIAFLSGRAENKTNVFRIRVNGGEAEQLTSEKGSITSFEWAPDGRRIAFTMTDPKSDDEEKAAKEKRDARVLDENEKLAGLYLLTIEKNTQGKRDTKRLVTGLHVTNYEWAPDGTAIAFSHQKTPKVFEQNDISIVNADGQVNPLVATGASEIDPTYSRDGRAIAYVASDDPPTWAFTGSVHVVPASGGPARPLAKTFDEQPNLLGWSADGKAVYVTETHGTIGRLSLLPADGAAPVLVSGTDANVGVAILNAAGIAIGFTQAWADKAPEPFLSKLPAFASKQIATVQQLPPAADAPLGRTEAIRWRAADGLDIEGLLTYPVDYQKGRKAPLLVVVHGGPTGVFTQSFIGMPGPYPVAAFASRGYAVLRVNPRGSSGYGRKFRYANYQDWGGGDFRDIMSGVDHVIGLGVADAERLGIMGWSYGGYMTSWTITQTKRFKAASVGAGVTNLMSFTGTADIPGFIPDYMGGEYWDVFDRWRSHSAMFNVKGVSTPTLIQHGEADVRVPISQGYELYNALVRQKVPTKMVVYPREPHGPQEPKHLKDLMERNLEWFDRYVRQRAGSN